MSKGIAWWQRIRFQLLGFGIIMSIVPLLVLGYANIKAARTNLEVSIQSQNTATARWVAENIYLSIDNIWDKLESVAGTYHQQFFLMNYQEQERVLYTLLRGSSLVEEMAIVDASGREAARVSRRRVITSSGRALPASSPEMKAVLAGRRGVGRAFLEEDGRPMVNLTVPVFDATGARVLGGMVAQVNLRGIVDNTVSVARGKSGYLFVVDETGRLLGHEDFSQVLQSRDVTGSGAVRQLLAGANPADLPVPYLYRSYTGREVLGVFSPVPDLGWGVVIEQPAAEAFAPVNRLLWKFGLTMVLVMAAVTSLSILFGFLFTRPIQELQQGTERIMAGDLEHALKVGAAGEVGSLVRAFNQMTRELKVKRNMEAAMRQADKLAAVGLLAAGVAHEINNPMGTVAAYTDDLLERLRTEPAEALATTGEMAEYLQVIRQQVARCTNITRSLVNFARQSRGEKQPVELNDLLRETVALVNFQARSKQITIDQRLEPGLPAVFADRGELQQVFLNLLQNAVDATEAGGQIQVSSSRGEDGVTVTVVDNGCGVPEQNLPRIFDPFFTTKPVGKGTGLGLSVCYGILSKLGGQIKVQSREGEGTAVTVTIPPAERDAGEVQNL